MTQSDFAELPVAMQTNLLLAVSLSEALRYWAPPTATAADIERLDAVVWETVAACTRMFTAGGRDRQALENCERLIAAVPDDWAQSRPTDAGN